MFCGLWIVATIFIVKLGCCYTLVWVLLLSCLGHDRAKNNSVLPCGLELCLIFYWDFPWLFFFLHRAMKGLIVAGMQWLVFGLCWLGRLLKAC